MLNSVELMINGEKYRVEVQAGELLVDTLRERLGLTGTKKGCGAGECGSCTIIMDGKAVSSCLVLTVKAEGKEIMTIEGLGDVDSLHPLQEKFRDLQALQCGFCGPGMLMSAKNLLDNNPRPTEQGIKKALAGNLCRCSGYVKIIEAVKAAAVAMEQKEGEI